MSAKDIAPYKGKRRKLLETLANAENADDGVDQICRKAGLSRTIYYKYIDEPQFRDALKSVVERTYARFAPQIANSMAKVAKTGNVKAASLIHQVLGFISSGNQSVNVAVHKDEPPTLPIDTPEQREIAIAQCTADLTILQELIANLKAMRQPAGNSRLGDGIHKENDETTTD